VLWYFTSVRDKYWTRRMRRGEKKEEEEKKDMKERIG
jgi:hypothetical protein